jgi:Fe-S oxidoreductase
MRIDADNQLIRGKGYVITFNEAKVFMIKNFADVLEDYIVAHKSQWIVDWMSVFKFAEETKILNVVVWQKQTNKN